MKKEFKEPEMNIEAFEPEDIIAATVSGVNDMMEWEGGIY